jgi:hypothetical protein
MSTPFYTPTPKEAAVIEQLSQEMDLTPAAVIRQALGHYQLLCQRIKAGETHSFSGDAQRARDFAGPLA